MKAVIVCGDRHGRFSDWLKPMRIQLDAFRRGVASKHTQKWRENAAAARERITWIDRSGKYVVDAVEGAGR